MFFLPFLIGLTTPLNWVNYPVELGTFLGELGTPLGEWGIRPGGIRVLFRWVDLYLVSASSGTSRVN